MSETLHIRTPVIYSHALSKKLGKKIYFKMDCHQPSGSFKIRGVGRRCQEAAAEGYTHFVIASGGNAGLAVAFSGWKMDIKVTVVVPQSTKKSMQQKLKDLGAEVIVHGEVWDVSNKYAQNLTAEKNTIYIPPFDHPTIWDGNATAIDECTEQMEVPDLVVVSVGGGGYFCGVAEGIERNNWDKTKIITAETHGTASMKRAVEAKELITLDKIESIASSLASKTVAKRALELALKHKVISYTVSDKEAIDACGLFLNETGNLVEPACGAALASVYNNMAVISEAESVLIMVCGGSGLNFSQFYKQYK